MRTSVCVCLNVYAYMCICVSHGICVTTFQAGRWVRTTVCCTLCGLYIWVRPKKSRRLDAVYVCVEPLSHEPPVARGGVRVNLTFGSSKSVSVNQ